MIIFSGKDVERKWQDIQCHEGSAAPLLTQGKRMETGAVDTRLRC